MSVFTTTVPWPCRIRPGLMKYVVQYPSNRVRGRLNHLAHIAVTSICEV
jgi:hypothetical protein